MTIWNQKNQAGEKKCFHLTLTRSFDVISFANRPLFRIGSRGRSDFWIDMNLNDEFSFAGVSSIHRLFAVFDPRKSTQPAEFLMETHPNFGWDSFLDSWLRLGSKRLR
jgi:hypothetical protein